MECPNAKNSSEIMNPFRYFVGTPGRLKHFLLLHCAVLRHFTLTKKRRLRVCEIKVLREIFGPKREKIVIY
jgi:hypothetical protein